jgi:hypothetical protein
MSSMMQHGLADAGAAEEADLAAAGVRGEKVHDLDARDEDLRFRGLLRVGGAGWWIGRMVSAGTGPASSTGSPITFMMRPERAGNPTGTAIGAPVSRTGWPRTRPSE